MNLKEIRRFFEYYEEQRGGIGQQNANELIIQLLILMQETLSESVVKRLQENTTGKCETCRHFIRDYGWVEKVAGNCHRYPPVLVEQPEYRSGKEDILNEETMWQQPYVRGIDTCGEWKEMLDKDAEMDTVKV